MMVEDDKAQPTVVIDNVIPALLNINAAEGGYGLVGDLRPERVCAGGSLAPPSAIISRQVFPRQFVEGSTCGSVVTGGCTGTRSGGANSARSGGKSCAFSCVSHYLYNSAISATGRNNFVA